MVHFRGHQLLSLLIIMLIKLIHLRRIENRNDDVKSVGRRPCLEEHQDPFQMLLHRVRTETVSVLLHRIIKCTKSHDVVELGSNSMEQLVRNLRNASVWCSDHPAAAAELHCYSCCQPI